MHNTSSQYRIAVIATLGAWASLAIAINPGCGPTPPTSPMTTASKPEMFVDVTPSCNLGPGKPSRDGLNKVQLKLIATDCQTSNCGGNSPTTNRFPINGLRSGCYNSQGVFLVPRSIANTKSSCNNKTLGVYKNRLIAQDAPDCQPEDLDGATFAVKRGPRSLPLRIQIHRTQRHFSNEKESFPAYTFTIPGEGAGQSLCSKDGSAIVYKELKTYNLLEDSGEYWHNKRANDDRSTDKDIADANDDDIAIIVEGEIHGEDGSTIESSKTIKGSKQSGWFNIACYEDALAKLDLDSIARHNPSPGADSQYYDRRDAALKMITANYCDKDRYTYDGNEIEWQIRTGPSSWSPDMDWQPETLEAIWGKDGAVCLSNSRLYKNHSTKPIPDWMYPNHCFKNKRCDTNKEFLQELNTVCPPIKPCEAGEQQGFFRSRPH